MSQANCLSSAEAIVVGAQCTLSPGPGKSVGVCCTIILIATGFQLEDVSVANCEVSVGTRCRRM